MKKIVWGAIIIGFITRLFLLFCLPIWHDEAYSIWMTQFSFTSLIVGNHDPVHPPLYYIFLKILSFVSDHLYWFRFSNLALFTLNVLLVRKVAEKFFSSKKTTNWTIILYSLSGYFLIFDWQVRMYTGVVTLILMSLLFWKRKQKTALFITLSLGLLFDYAFFWFYLVLVAKQLLDLIETKKKKKKLKNLIMMITAGIPFLLWLLLSPTSVSDGAEGIQWMFNYLKPKFFISFFLGSHHPVLTLVSIIGIIYFNYKFFKEKNSLNETMLDIWFFSAVLASGLLTLSVFYTPVFHVRSLQIVPLFSMLLLSEVFSKIKKEEIWAVLILLAINFSFTTYLNLRMPGKVLVSPFHCKKVYRELEKKGDKKLYCFYKKKLPTPILEWGLHYTFSGKENIGTNKMKLEKIDKRPKNCELLYNNLVELYLCD